MSTNGARLAVPDVTFRSDAPWAISARFSASTTATPTHAGEDGATEADLMSLSGHEDRRTLQRYLKPSKEGTHRLDEIDAHRGTWTPEANDLATRMATH
ncbi:MAG: hypothetical protein ACRDRL_17980 [Sciscionella sp.]